MFVGHLAVAFAAKKAKPEVHVGWFIVAVSFVDLIWPILLLLGLERVEVEPGNTAFTPLAFVHYPWTHSLLMGFAWAAVLAGLARWRGVARNGAALIGALVLSHWVLDFVTHRPDLPLWPHGGPLLGLGLWNSIGGTFAIEGAMWTVGIAMWYSACRPRGVGGWAAIVSFVLVSTVIWAGGAFAPPPPTAQDVAVGALMGWIIVPWAWWIERASAPRGSLRENRPGAPAN